MVLALLLRTFGVAAKRSDVGQGVTANCGQTTSLEHYTTIGISVLVFAA